MPNIREELREQVDFYNSCVPDQVKAGSHEDFILHQIEKRVRILGYHFYRDDDARVFVLSKKGKINGKPADDAIYPSRMTPVW